MLNIPESQQPFQISFYLVTISQPAVLAVSDYLNSQCTVMLQLKSVKLFIPCDTSALSKDVERYCLPTLSLAATNSSDTLLTSFSPFYGNFTFQLVKSFSGLEF